jgi:hypothetical protein
MKRAGSLFAGGPPAYLVRRSVYPEPFDSTSLRSGQASRSEVEGSSNSAHQEAVLGAPYEHGSFWNCDTVAVLPGIPLSTVTVVAV